MFNLIITIISIALVAVLAVATIYYGGSVFSTQGKEVDTAKLLNSSAHIKGALEMYRNDHAGNSPAALTDLTPFYLKAIPDGAGAGTWTVSGQYAITTLGASTDPTAQDACAAVNVKLGRGSAIPSCADPSIANVQVCCDTAKPYP